MLIVELRMEHGSGHILGIMQRAVFRIHFQTGFMKFFFSPPMPMQMDGPILTVIG